MLTFYAAKFTRDLKLPANLHILFTSCSSHVVTFYTEFYSETAFHFGFEESEVFRGFIESSARTQDFPEDTRETYQQP